MKCKRFLVNLSLYVNNELDDSSRGECEKHAKICPNCRALIREQSEMDDLLAFSAECDENEAEGMLSGFEARLLARRREDRATGRVEKAPSKSRFLRFSLGLNFGAVAALVCMLLFSPGLLRDDSNSDQRGRVAEQKIMSVRDMRTLLQETESFFGPRFSWVAESGQGVALGLARETNHSPDGPAVALVYWLEAVGDAPSRDVLSDPVVILTRPGREIRHFASGEKGELSMEITVTSLIYHGGRFTVRTQVRPVWALAFDENVDLTQSALLATATFDPERPVKLGQVRAGNRLYNAFLTARDIGERKTDDAILS